MKSSRLSTFLSELKRRRVFRVAVVYAGVAFIIIQIIDGAFDYLPIPDWVGTAIIVVLLVGFPIAVALAWAFDITEKGVVRAAKEPAEAKASRRVLIGNKTLAIVAAVAVAAAVWSYLSKGEQPGPITSIAVLPLENLMNDPDQDYFVDGMHEALISELGKISALRVISRTSAMHYKDTDKLLPEIARELGVDAVVEGSVLRAGDRVRITAQLVGTAPERHLWTDNYTRDLRDILTLQSEVARAIAKEIKATLTPEEEARLAAARSVNTEAYEAYLKARHYLNRRTEEGYKKAIYYFQQAIEKDPGYALPYAGLADSYALLGNYGLLPPKEVYLKAQQSALKALELDNTLAEAQTSLAFITANFNWDWVIAESAYRRAIELGPNYVTAHHWLAYLLGVMGRFDEGIREIKRGLEFDPLSLELNTALGWQLLYSREYDQAITQFRKTLELDPNHAVTHLWLGSAYEQKGMYKEAIAVLQMGTNLSGSSPFMLAALGHADAQAGQRDDALKILKELTDLSYQRYVSPYDIALVYAGLVEKEKAFEWLEKAYEERSTWLNRLKVGPMWDPLRDDPRFQDLLRRMNFPE